MDPTYGRLYNETFTLGYADERTQREVAFAVAHLEASAACSLLDVGCNQGRHSIALALRGYHVTGVDPEPEAIALAREQAAKAGATVEFVCAAIEAVHLAGFDTAICLGTSLGFHGTDEGDQEQLNAIAAALVPGGRFIIETTTLLTQAYGTGTRREWWRDGDTRVLDEGTFDATTCRAHHVWEHWRGNEVRRREERYRVYAAPELIKMLRLAGFRLDTLYGNYTGAPFDIRSASFIGICTRES